MALFPLETPKEDVLSKDNVENVIRKDKDFDCGGGREGAVGQAIGIRTFYPRW